MKKMIFMVLCIMVLMAAPVGLCIAEPQQIVSFWGNWSVVEDEVSFIQGQNYTVMIGEKNRHRPLTPLQIYKDSTLVFKTELYGDIGGIYKVNLRGDGKSDLIVVLSTGNSGAMTDFRIIGDNGQGIGVLANLETMSAASKFPTSPQLIQGDGNTAIEYTPAGSWPRYRTDIAWDADTSKYVLINRGRVTPVSEMPPTDRTVSFSIKEPGKVYFFDRGNVISHIGMKVGETLLLKRDTSVAQELFIQGNYYPQESLSVDLRMIEGDFLITAKNPGEGKIVLWPRHYAAEETLSITVEP